MQSDIKRLRETGDYSDITFIVSGREFKAHKIFLCMCSEYFSRMLNGDFTESIGDKVELKNVEPEIFSMYLNYVYRRKFTLFLQKGTTKPKDWKALAQLITYLKYTLTPFPKINLDVDLVEEDVHEYINFIVNYYGTPPQNALDKAALVIKDYVDLTVYDKDVMIAILSSKCFEPTNRKDFYERLNNDGITVIDLSVAERELSNVRFTSTLLPTGPLTVRIIKGITGELYALGSDGYCATIIRSTSKVELPINEIITINEYHYDSQVRLSIVRFVKC